MTAIALYVGIAWLVLTCMYVAACLLDSRGEWRGTDPGVAPSPQIGRAPVSSTPQTQCVTPELREQDQ